MKLTNIKFLAVGAIGIFSAAVMTFDGAPRAQAKAGSDPAAIYKTKCSACHTPTATKFYDPAMPDAEQIDAILKGKKGEKPPYMPAFGDKGVTEEDAAALVAYMKGLRCPPK